MSPFAALHTLSIDERRVITLWKVYDCRSPEIADRLHMSQAQVDAVLAQAMRHFAAALETDT